MCLGSIAIEIDHGDDRSLRRALSTFVPLLWDEGLEQTIRGALERAGRRGVPHAVEALSVVDRRGHRAPIVTLVVLQYARELSRRVNGPRATNSVALS